MENESICEKTRPNAILNRSRAKIKTTPFPFGFPFENIPLQKAIRPELECNLFGNIFLFLVFNGSRLYVAHAEKNRRIILISYNFPVQTLMVINCLWATEYADTDCRSFTTQLLNSSSATRVDPGQIRSYQLTNTF